MNGSLLLEDSALGLLGIGLGVLADEVDTLDDHTVLFGDDGEDLTGLSLIVSGVDVNGVAFFDLKLLHRSKF
jgi:hypothetical protein